MIQIERKKLEQVLEALERYQVKRQDFITFDGVIATLEEALAKPDQLGQWASRAKELLNVFAENDLPEISGCIAKPKPQPEQRQPLTDEAELSNGLAMALHDAVLIRLGKDDESTRQATARIDKLVNKYKTEAAHNIK